MTDNEQLFETHDAFVRLLTASDRDTIHILYGKCSDYFELIQGKPAGAAESQNLFTSLPEGKDYADNYVLGIFSVSTGRLIGVIDLIRDFRTPGEWTLGLMLLDPESRALGTGGRIYQSLSCWGQSKGATSIRLGVVEGNDAALYFWHKMGFEEFERKSARYGSKDHTLIVMRQGLKSDHCANPLRLD